MIICHPGFPHNGKSLAVVGDELERLMSFLLIHIDDAGANAIDGPEFKLVSIFVAKLRTKSCAHLICCSNRIGTGKNFRWVYTFSIDEIAEPCK